MLTHGLVSKWAGDQKAKNLQTRLWCSVSLGLAVRWGLLAVPCPCLGKGCAAAVCLQLAEPGLLCDEPRAVLAASTTLALWGSLLPRVTYCPGVIQWQATMQWMPSSFCLWITKRECGFWPGSAVPCHSSASLTVAWSSCSSLGAFWQGTGTLFLQHLSLPCHWLI